MKRRMTTALAAILMLGCVLAQPFPDVPEGHWAGDAVERLAELGIVVGFPDGTFRGNEGFTRYEAALVIDRLLRVVSESEDARDAALARELEVLRDSVSALGDETTQLRREAEANRAALELLWEEVARLRAELDLPPPAPLPVAPERGPQGEPGPAGAPGAPGATGAPATTVEVPAPEDLVGDVPEDAEPDAADEAAPRAEEPAVSEIDADADVVVFGPAPRTYVGLAVGTGLPAAPLVRAVAGVDDFPAPRFGARLAVDLGRRSAAPLGSVAFTGHVTYRVLEATSLHAFAGAGAGIQLSGEGPFASLLFGGAWMVADPIQLFAETTVDVYFQPALPSGGSRISPTLVLGARWNF